MKKFTGIAAAALMAATVGGALTVPTAANAQLTIRFGEPRYWTPERSGAIRQQIWRLDNQIERAVQRRAISPREARQLNRQVRNLQYRYNAYARNGLSLGEVRALQNQVNRIRNRLRMERLDWDREDYWRGNRWRDFDRDGVHNRYDRDRDNDGVRNRYDRDDDNDGVRDRYDRYDSNPRRY